MSPKWMVSGLLLVGCSEPDPGTQPTDDTSTGPASDTGLSTACETEPPTEPAPPPQDLAAIPPIVVHTVPANLDWEVDPALPAIEVAFSQDMDPRGRAWIQIGDDTFPETGEATWVDARTDRMEVTLEPDHTYVVQFNVAPFLGFQSTEGVFALSHTLVFHTRAE